MTNEQAKVERVARAIERELVIDEALDASPSHLRRIKANRIARAAIAAMEADDD